MKWSAIEKSHWNLLCPRGTEKFDTRIFGGELQIISGHKPLTYLNKCAPHGAKLSRQALGLQRYNMSVTYRKGSRPGNADVLSGLKFDSPY